MTAAAVLHPSASETCESLYGSQQWLRSDLEYGVAQTIREVTDSWRLVYAVYVKTGLIDPNPELVHSAPMCYSPKTAVFRGVTDSGVESTMTAFLDDEQPHGLPLDVVYQAELDGLRAQGKRLLEYGLFAHRGQILWERSWGTVPGTFDANEAQKSRRVKESLFELMRWAFHFGRVNDCEDFVIGVHPRHARFYARAFGFRQIGDLRTYPKVKNKPVVLLHGSVSASIAMPTIPPALQYCLDNPLSEKAFASRFRFSLSQAQHRFTAA